MARCTHCQSKWKISEVWSLGFSKSGKKCSNCGTTQYISQETKNLFTLGWISLIVVPFLFFRIKLSDRDEPLW
ncbi:hypothetical protein [Jeotgalibacillus sp. R-1-5s-1]|uniref:hypothetical protein n=1 Tax=Jeotgalibacillus sp. R-1-5s-1 TaxID=2555897 RepID=UPI001069CD5C|nr:hypothetical protein [Jeotgalibacillus sp. R-1-5s-1]TFD94406.1 hypothetical protein E2491_13285 [Jeotgalibacillus sp. R-1-5s-1]